MKWPDAAPKSCFLAPRCWARSSEARSEAAGPSRNNRSPFRAPARLRCGWWSASSFCRSRSGQDDMGTLVTLRDVESRRQLEQQLDFSSRLAAISRLTGGVAHEIKNPLNAMALHLEVLKGKLDGQQPEIEVIGREIKRLDSVVKTFLNFNRPVDLNYKPIDLNELVKQVLALVSVDANAKNIALKTVLAGEPALDPGRSGSAAAGHFECDQQWAGSHDGRRNPDHQNRSRWRPVPAHCQRCGPRNRARDPAPGVPTLLHYQRDRLGDWSRHHISSSATSQWYNRLYQRAWKGYDIPAALSKNGRLPG